MWGIRRKDMCVSDGKGNDFVVDMKIDRSFKQVGDF